MTANQCHRPVLPNPLIYESFSVCSLRTDQQSGVTTSRDALTKCCKTTVKPYQCWAYCGVEESQFSTWLGCVQQATGWNNGFACQRADQSPVSTATTPYPSTYTPPAPPLGYTPPPTLTTSSTSALAMTSSVSSSVATNIAAEVVSPNSSDNEKRSTADRSAAPTAVLKSGSSKTSTLSLSGILCGFLVFSSLAL